MSEINLSDAYLSGSGSNWKVLYSENLKTLEDKVMWSSLMWHFVQDLLSESRTVKPFNWGVNWANKVEKSIKSDKERELLYRRKAVEQYLLDSLPKFDNRGNKIEYSPASLKKSLETGIPPKKALSVRRYD